MRSFACLGSKTSSKAGFSTATGRFKNEPNYGLTPLLASALLLISLVMPASAQRALERIPIHVPERSEAVDFEREILPILKQNCLACHNQAKPKGGLVLETPPLILKGGDNGPAASVSKPAESLLLRASAHQDPDLEMPPPDNKVAGHPLTPEELGLIQLWIAQGAKGEVRGLGPVAWQPLPSAVQAIFALALTGDGRFAACGRGNRVFLYDISSRQLLQELSDPKLSAAGPGGAAHHDTVNSLAFSEDGGLLASGGYREVKIWRRSGPAKLFQSESGARIIVSAHGGDGKWVAAGTTDGGLWLWPGQGGVPRFLRQLVHVPTALALSPDSSLLAVVSSTDLHILKTADGAVVMSCKSQSDLSAAAWTGLTNLAVGGTNGAIRILAVDAVRGLVTTNQEVKVSGAVLFLAASPDSTSRLLSSASDGSVVLWDLNKGKAKFETKLETPSNIVALRPDGKRVAVATGSSVKLWNVSNSKLVAEITGDPALAAASSTAEREHDFAIDELEYRKTTLHDSETNRQEIVLRRQRAVDTNAALAKIVLDRQSSLTNALQARDSAAKALDRVAAKARSAVEAYLAAEFSGENDATNLLGQAKAALDEFPRDSKEEQKKPEAKKLRDARESVAKAEKALRGVEEEKSTTQHELGLASAALVKGDESVLNNKNLLSGAERALHEAEESLRVAKEKAASASKPFRAVAFSPDNSRLLTVGDDGVLRSWGAESGAADETLGRIPLSFQPANAVSANPQTSSQTNPGPNSALGVGFDGPDRVAVRGPSGIAGWELTSHWRLERLIGDGGESSPLADRVNALQFTPDGKQLITGGGEPSRDGEIKFWDTADGRPVRELKHVHSDSVLSVELSADGKYLASAGADRFARVTEIATGKVLKNFEGHVNHVLGVAWEHNGRRLWTAGADNAAKLWEFETGEKLKNLENFAKEVTSVSFIGLGGRAWLTAGDGQVIAVNDKGEKKSTMNGPEDYYYGGGASADGLIVVAGGASGVLRVWNGRDGSLVKEFRPSAP